MSALTTHTHTPAETIKRTLPRKRCLTKYSINKYQFGTVMPGSQPVAFEYQPLGLEAFAQPIAQRQKMFDTTLDALDSASFNIECLHRPGR